MAERLAGCSQEGNGVFSSPIDAETYTPAIRQQNRLIRGTVEGSIYCTAFVLIQAKALVRVYAEINKDLRT
jgi:hypothetical protein